MATEREVILAKREGFFIGANWFYTKEQVPRVLGNLLDDAPRAAREAYPLPKISRPLHVTLSDGHKVSYEPRNDGDIAPYVLHDSFPRSRRSAIGLWNFVKCDSDIVVLARIIAGETELVDDDGEAQS